MGIWEYRIVHFEVGGAFKTTIHDSLLGTLKSSGAGKRGDYIKLMANYLNHIGSEGWEVVNAISTWTHLEQKEVLVKNSIVSPTFLLKRQR